MLTVDDIHVRFGGVQALRGVSLQVEGRDITARRPARIAALGVARTFQNVAMFPSLSVLDNLMLGRHLHMRAGVLARSWTGGRLGPKGGRDRWPRRSRTKFVQVRKR